MTDLHTYDFNAGAFPLYKTHLCVFSQTLNLLCWFQEHCFRIGRNYLEFPTGIPVHSLLYLHEQNNTVYSTNILQLF